MSDPKGPKLDIPPDLEDELSGSGEASEEESSGGPAPEVEIVSEGGPAEASLEASPSDLEAEVERLRAEVAELKDRQLRQAADYANQRRRLLREQQDAVTYANENLFKELLQTVDNLERALSHARAGEAGAGVDPHNLLEGVELTLRSLMGVLERGGVEVVDACDTKFDPRHHEAMRQVPSAEHEPGSVVEVYQKGYLLRGRLLRPALVAVATAVGEESPSTN